VNQIKNSKQEYGLGSIIFHWASVLIIIFMFVLGYWMVGLGYYDSWYKTGPELHKSIGMSFFLFMFCRVIWKQRQVQPEPLKNHAVFERKLGYLIHLFLYLLIFFIMINGYLISTADDRGIEVFRLFEVPSLGAFFENQEDIAGEIHQYSAYLLVFTVILHASAALKHHFFDKDKTLSRMLGKK